jgi:hypothetical protein
MKKYSFEAEIHPARGGGAFVEFPFGAEQAFGTKGRVPVHVTIDGIAGRSSLMRMGHPCHVLGVPKATRQRLGKEPGDKVRVVLWKDDTPREVEVPPEFKGAMKRAGVLAFFESLSFTHRKEYCRWITEAKKEETRARRLARAVDMLRDSIRTPG